MSLLNCISITALIVVLTSIASESDGLTIVSRKEWGARPPKSPPEKLPQIPTGLVVIHHGASPACNTSERCINLVKIYQNHHMDTKKWNDIGYNFVVGEDGNVYEGRGWNVVGAHAVGANLKSVGICIIGDFSNSVPSAAAVAATQQLIGYGVEKAYIGSDYKLIGHRQVVQLTSCPGDSFYKDLEKWPHYSSVP